MAQEGPFGGAAARRRPELAAEPSVTYAVAESVIRDVGGGGSRRRVTATIDAALAGEVGALVRQGCALSVSRAVEEALGWWVRNQWLRLDLDRLQEEHPEVRPTDEQIRQAERLLGLE